MKILIVTDAWEPQVNGVVRTLKMTKRELENRGHTVEIMSPQGFKSMPCPTYPEIDLALTTPGEVARRIDALGIDCLHIATEGPLGWLARGVAIKRNWPFTTAYHSRFPEYVHARMKFPISWSYSLLRKFHNAGQSTLAPTPAIVDDLLARGFTKARLWSRGVDLQSFSPNGPKFERGPEPVFLYVGRLAVEKQVQEFLKLDLPGQMWVAGEGPARQKLEAQYPNKARWFGVLQGPELASLYRSADVKVFPSVTDTFGLVMVEAMACGTPVAAFPVPGPIDVVGHNSNGGAIDTDLRAACMAALTKNRDLVRQHAEQFNWPKATAQFEAALQPLRRSGVVAA